MGRARINKVHNEKFSEPSEFSDEEKEANDESTIINEQEVEQTNVEKTILKKHNLSEEEINYQHKIDYQPKYLLKKN